VVAAVDARRTVVGVEYDHASGEQHQRPGPRSANVVVG
jgi:hypothetical protein